MEINKKIIKITEKETNHAQTFENQIRNNRLVSVLTLTFKCIMHGKHKNSFCNLYFNKNLNKLVIEKIKTKVIQINEICIAEKIKRSGPINLEKGNQFNLVTITKVFEFSTENKQARKEFVRLFNFLVQCYQEFAGTHGLKYYCESFSRNLFLKGDFLSVDLNNTKEIIEHKDYLFEIIKGVLNQVIFQIEITEATRESSKLKYKIALKMFERSELLQIQAQLISKLDLKSNEIINIQGKIKKINSFLKFRSFFTVSTIFTLKIWKNILEFLNFPTIFQLRNSSKKTRDLTNKILQSKKIWRGFCTQNLRPRNVSYSIFIEIFHKSHIRGPTNEVDPKIIEEIHSDVLKGLSDNNKNTEEVLINLCQYNSNLNYCQGMQFVAHFLLSIFHNQSIVLKTLDSLLRPPFFLLELWKNDFYRLQLGIFQLEFLLKLRLPLIYKHFKKQEISLNTIVTPWFLTVFIHFYYQHEFDKEKILKIWDYFLVNGWSGLLSVCLSIFFLSEKFIYGKNYEKIVSVLTSKVPLDNISEVVSKFEIDELLLEELESSFLCHQI